MQHILDKEQLLKEVETIRIFLEDNNCAAGDWVCIEMSLVKCLSSAFYWRSVEMERARILTMRKTKVPDVQG